jgi:aryl-alcohol dehydrogenase-like predicted oxidoreductase
MAQIALAWVLRNPVVSAPILGATRPHHLTEAVAALHIELSQQDVDALEASYDQHGTS